MLLFKAVISIYWNFFGDSGNSETVCIRGSVSGENVQIFEPDFGAFCL